MIKFKKIQKDVFLRSLTQNAVLYNGNLRIFGNNEYSCGGKGFYYCENKNKIILYYETGKCNKQGKISSSKNFMLCRFIKLFKHDFVFSIIIPDPFLLMCVLLYSIIFTLISRFNINAVLSNLIINLLIVYFLNFTQSVNLLNFIDEIVSNIS